MTLSPAYSTHTPATLTLTERALVLLICLVLSVPLDMPAAAARFDITPTRSAEDTNPAVYLDDEIVVPTDSTARQDLFRPDADVIESDTVLTVVDHRPYGLDGEIPFNPIPERAVWLSALMPGLGQIYNRRYWKLPIIVGGFMGLGYATGWNNAQLRDYSQGYRDLMDADPSTNSYMNFFPPNTEESSLDKSWLQQVMKSRKDYYRRNRDLCIICIAALYLLCMLDAYVDASMAHFDISPNLSMDVQPALLPAARQKYALGLAWALNF